LPKAATFAADIRGAIISQGFAELPITLRDAQLAGELPGDHRDPFDRMLVVQAILSDLVLISNETVLDRWAVHRLW